MAKLTTNLTDLSYVVESTPGTTPATPTFQLLPTTSNNLQANITTQVSEVIRSDRQIDDLTIVDAETSGEINFELSYTPYKPIILQLMRNTPVSISMAAVSADFSDTGTITASGETFVTEGIVVGMNVSVAGASTAANNRVYKVTAVSETVLTVSPAPNTTEAGQTITIDGYMIRNGAALPTTNTFMKRVNDVTPYYFYYDGTVISNMSMTFATATRITGAISLMGRVETPTDTAISGQDVLDVPDYSIMNSVNNIQEINVTGLPLTTCFNSLDLQINNNSTGAKCIGTLGNSDIQDFTFEVTGSIETYFENLVLYEKFKNSDAFSIAITLQDTDGNTMVVTIPRAKFEELSMPIDGKDQFLMLPGKIRALRDATTNCTLQFDFFDAATSS